MVSVSTESWAGSADEVSYQNHQSGDKDVSEAFWLILVFDVLLAFAVLVDLLLIVVVVSDRSLRRGPSAVFIIALASFDLTHLVAIRIGSYILSLFRTHLDLICKVDCFSLLQVTVLPE